MIDPSQFRDYIVRPALERTGTWSKSAERLVLGTAIVESRLTYLKQVGGGPALGIFQCEPATCHDIWDNFISKYQGLNACVKGLMAPNYDRVEQLAWNLQYAAAICRIHYFRLPFRLPDENDLPGMAAIWKKYYNTHLGAGTVEKFISGAQACGLMKI